jgi:hypothetical protein
MGLGTGFGYLPLNGFYNHVGEADGFIWCGTLSVRRWNINYALVHTRSFLGGAVCVSVTMIRAW